MIVDRAVYRRGTREPCGDLSDELARLRTNGDGFLWIGLKDPTDEELAHVQEELALHPLAVEDSIKGNQRPKLEVYDGSVFVALRALRYDDETSQVETGGIMVFIGDAFAVTVRRGDVGALSDVRARLERSPDELAQGPVAVLYAVMDRVVDGYLDIDAEIGLDLEEMEESVFASEVTIRPETSGRPTSLPPRMDAHRIYLLKREVLEIRRAVMPLTDPATRLARRRVPFVPEEARPFFRDIADHLLRIADHIESYDRLLTEILSAHMTRVFVQQNDDMRRISAWVAMAAVPTLVASIYGMNFDHMPELHWTLGYPFVLVAMSVTCAALYRAFKRSGWL